MTGWCILTLPWRNTMGSFHGTKITSKSEVGKKSSGRMSQANAMKQWTLLWNSENLCLGIGSIESKGSSPLASWSVCSVQYGSWTGQGQNNPFARLCWHLNGHLHGQIYNCMPFFPLPYFGWHCSISNRLYNQCGWWPHSDWTGQGSICCWHYWQPSTLSTSQTTQLEKHRSGPWEQFQHITGMIAEGHSHHCEAVCSI